MSAVILVSLAALVGYWMGLRIGIRRGFARGTQAERDFEAIRDESAYLAIYLGGSPHQALDGSAIVPMTPEERRLFGGEP